MHHRRKFSTLTAAGAAGVTFAAMALASAATATAAPTGGATPTRAVVADTGTAGLTAKTVAVPDGSTVGVSVFVGRHMAALRALALAASNPKSPTYRHFLTESQLRSDYGATVAQRHSVAAWLRASGLSVTHNDRFVVTASGTAAQAESALQAPIERTVGTDSSRLVAGHDVSVPAALAKLVVTVNLRGAQAPAVHHEPLPKTQAVVPGSVKAQTIKEKCSKYYGQKKAKGTPEAYGAVQTWAVCGYLPSQIRDAYGVTKSGQTGQGVTIGILSGDNDSTAEADADQWAKNRGEPQFQQGQYTAIIGSGTPNGVGDVESALDVESAHGMAPAADVIYSAGSGSVTGDGLLDGFAQFVSNGKAQVITSSWFDGYMGGVPQSLIEAWEDYLTQATALGMSVNFATGDYSDTTPLQYPGSDPMITCVGGTSLAIGKGGKNLWEAPWATDEANLSGTQWVPAPPGSYAEGGTGGISTYFSEPSWQKGVVPKKIDKTGMRAVPDVADLGDWNLGYQIGYTEYQGGPYVEGVNGGTSLSSPLFTGMEADAVQEEGGTSLGFANPLIYSLAGSKAFHDVVQYPEGKSTTLAVVYGPSYGQNPTLSTMAQCQSTVALVCGKGYDTVTGVGSPGKTFFSSFGG